MSMCLITEVKQQWATWLLGWVTTQWTTPVYDHFAAHSSEPKTAPSSNVKNMWDDVSLQHDSF